MGLHRRRVILESPFGGDVETNKAYLRECIRDSLKRYEAPFASHRMYTDALDDSNPDERGIGIDAGFVWRSAADITVFYVDLGWSRGMLLGRDDCDAKGLRYETRTIRP